MTSKVKIESRKMTDEGGKLWWLDYYVRKFDIKTGDRFYGIKIEQRPADSSLPAMPVSEETKGLTYSYEEAENWVRQLAAGEATPATFHGHIDDFVGG